MAVAVEVSGWPICWRVIGSPASTHGKPTGWRRWVCRRRAAAPEYRCEAALTRI